MQELIVFRGTQELVVLPLDKDTFRLGRSPTNDLAIPEPTVSRHQCELVRKNGQWSLFDKSGKGTEVGGRIYTETRLEMGSRIDFGSLSITLRESDAADANTKTVSLGGTGLMSTGEPETQKLYLTGRIQGKATRQSLSGPLLAIGSDPGNSVVITDPFVSSFHCRLFTKDGVWYITDLDSTNGTRVNGVQISEAPLEAGSTIQIGHANLRIESYRDKQEDSFFGIISVDAGMQSVFDLIKRIAPSNEIVLITGESGSGKELVAHALHKLSLRKHKTMIPLNCSAITKELQESELFGHEKGAFTGAVNHRKGMFEEADGGTLFMDEIGELSQDLQAKLLRVLESGEIRKVGSNHAKQVDTRIIAATHRSLAELVQKNQFREDLYYRINVLDIALPPLRKRPLDIILLAEHFLNQATGKTRRCHLSNKAKKHLRQYHYPGNVRELKHIITRAALLSPKEGIGPEQLTFSPPTLADKVSESQTYQPGKTLRQVEIDTIQQALASTGNNRKASARILGIARSTLIDKMERYSILVGSKR
jgi:DNA-binding NtrC family response regulator